ncbi:MAG: bifunctional UDP-N-acetylglucosamine pyrophosphorylase / Glucosamine-1-phosphate N-acetyltransferase [Parcubacteria group bacterium Greene0714_7]|nr:MAG: bifunctional UDP-N-acetylglucosamine pyrophosphorylase / Glucosamine-1-phosphate N-acetyltransferase [Parcubacteria group bacterium Greene0714_7]
MPESCRLRQTRRGREHLVFSEVSKENTYVTRDRIWHSPYYFFSRYYLFMQALILAGGEGRRLRPLTDDKPKGMVLLNGKPLLEYVLEQLPDAVTDIIIIIGYKGEKIQEYFGSDWKGKPIRYIVQEKQIGTWNAVYLAKELINEKFIMLYGDDIGDKQAFTKGVEYEYCLFVAEKEHPERYGVVELNPDGTLKEVVEKPENPVGNLVNSGAMILSPDMFLITPFAHPRLGEYFLTDMLSVIAKEKPVAVVRQNQWITVTYPEDVAVAETLLKKV